MLTLLECMKNNLPSNDSSKFKTTESHMDWEKVAFKDFSGDMCKLKWVEISNEVTDPPFLTHAHTYTNITLSSAVVGEVKQAVNRKERHQERRSCGRTLALYLPLCILGGGTVDSTGLKLCHFLSGWS